MEVTSVGLDLGNGGNLRRFGLGRWRSTASMTTGPTEQDCV